MDSRERTFLALNHQEPDRVPVDFWASSGTKEKIESGLGISYQAFLDLNDVDLRYIEGPAYIGPDLADDQGSTAMDIWGVQRRRVQVTLHDGVREDTETYREVSKSPLANMKTVDEILDYDHWPSADWFDYSVGEKQCRDVREGGRIAVFMGDRLNRIAQLKPAMYLRGMEQIFIDMVENPEIAGAIFQKITTFYLEYEQRIIEAAGGMIDILCTGDDFGSQNGLLISPSMWNTFLRDGFQKFISLGKDGGTHVMHHTCGSVYQIIPDLIECGLDILQSLQPEALDMGPAKLKAEFGKLLSFQGGVSIQRVLPRGKTQDVRDHVRSLFREMASGGGYIACTSHNIQADTPLSNIEALFEAYREFGRY